MIENRLVVSTSMVISNNVDTSYPHSWLAGHRSARSHASANVSSWQSSFEQRIHFAFRGFAHPRDAGSIPAASTYLTRKPVTT